MSAVELRAFEDDHVVGAAAVLRRRHESHLVRQPLLAEAPEFEAIVAAERTDATGAVALADGQVVGYLLGRHADGPIGPHAWSSSAGHAADDPRLVPDLYAVAAQAWVAAGLVRHFVFAPAMRAAVEPWFRIGFGASAVQAARRVAAPVPDGADRTILVRRSTPEDLEAVAVLVRELPLQLVASPSFSEVAIESVEDVIAEWGDTWTRDEYVHFVAASEGRLVGQLLLYRRPSGDLRVPLGSLDLAHVTTARDMRGRGVASALFDEALRFAAAEDSTVMTTDWRASNLLAARVWPRRGFEPTYLRLARAIP